MKNKDDAEIKKFMHACDVVLAVAGASKIVNKMLYATRKLPWLNKLIVRVAVK